MSFSFTAEPRGIEIKFPSVDTEWIAIDRAWDEKFGTDTGNELVDLFASDFFTEFRDQLWNTSLSINDIDDDGDDVWFDMNTYDEDDKRALADISNWTLSFVMDVSRFELSRDDDGDLLITRIDSDDDECECIILCNEEADDEGDEEEDDEPVNEPCENDFLNLDLDRSRPAQVHKPVSDNLAMAREALAWLGQQFNVPIKDHTL